MIAAPIQANSPSWMPSAFSGGLSHVETRKAALATTQASRNPNRPYFDPAWYAGTRMSSAAPGPASA